MNERVPEGWEIRTSENIYVRLKVPKVYDRNMVEETGSYPVLDQSTSGEIGFLESDPDFVCDINNPIVTFANHTCAVRKMTTPFGVIQNVFPLTSRSDTDIEFIFQILNGGVEQEGYKGHYPKLRETEFLLPPLPEQKKIASILTSVDEVIETTQKQIDKLQDLKKATMNELLTKGIGHTEFKDSELGRIPKSWGVKAISEIVSIPNGQVNPKIEPYASMPHIGSGNIISWTGQNKDVQTAFQAGQISGKYLFNANHILYSKVRPNLAKVCMPKFDGVCSADIYPLLPKEQISGKFIFQYLLTEQFTQIATEVSERTGMPKINRQDLSVIKLPVPPFKEQLEIAKKVEAIDDAMSLKTKKISQTQSLKKSLMQDLLTGKVRVQVN